jgi:hypothetical protein
MPTVRLDPDVYEGLQKLARPFVDSPSMVIRRLLEKEGLLAPGTETPAPAGALTPQSVYEAYLLHLLLKEAGGRSHKRDITHAVVKRMLKDGHIGAAEQELVKTGETRAENTLTWARNALKGRGFISRLAARGIWELTPDGRAAAEKVVLPRPR